jgi:hypothetical protein
MRRKTARTPCKPGPGGPDRYEINNAGACCALASQPSGAGHAATTWRWAHVGVVPSGCLLCARLRPGHAPLSACFQCSARLCRISWSSCRRTYLRLVRAGQPLRPGHTPLSACCVLALAVPIIVLPRAAGQNSTIIKQPIFAGSSSEKLRATLARNMDDHTHTSRARAEVANNSVVSSLSGARRGKTTARLSTNSRGGMPRVHAQYRIVH